jgi:hypothetical protein
MSCICSTYREDEKCIVVGIRLRRTFDRHGHRWGIDFKIQLEVTEQSKIKINVL